MKLTHDNACIEEILFIKLYQNLSKDSKDMHISLFIPFSGFNTSLWRQTDMTKARTSLACMHNAYLTGNRFALRLIWKSQQRQKSLLTKLRQVCAKLTVTQLIKKFPVFYETHRYITMITTILHWPLF
jgi:hypothetical protein